MSDLIYVGGSSSRSRERAAIHHASVREFAVIESKVDTGEDFEEELGYVVLDEISKGLSSE
jgi:hypothetical protein